MRKIAKATICLTLALAILAIATACTPKPPANTNGNGDDGFKKLIWGSMTEPVTLDPLSAQNTADGRSILFNVFEGLVKPEPDGSLSNCLAQSYEIDEAALVYTFRIREGVLFHNGATLTAEDVKYSILQAQEQSLPGLSAIEGIDANGMDLEVVLSAPDTFFLPYLTVGVVPDGYEDREANPVGTGPFYIASYSPQQNLVLAKHESYWKSGVPLLDEVVVKFAADTGALLSSLQAGVIDGSNVNYVQAGQLDESQFNFTNAQSASVQALFLNNAVEPLDNINVRKAIAYAVDKGQIVQTVFNGHGTLAGSPMIPGLKQYVNNDIADAYPTDIQMAKSLLEKAGYPDGFELKITIASNYTMHVDTGQMIVNQLEQIGIKGTIELVDLATWLSSTYRGRQYEATIISVDGSLSPSSFMSRYQSQSESNFVNYSSEKYDELFSRAIAAIDIDERIELFKQAQQTLSDDVASVYLQDIDSIWAIKKEYSGIVDYPIYVFDFSKIVLD
ncbi:MAG: ABC transporter substrate-binding protein [Eubacteriaceae bacterium]|nr:ABC transporter substrate-binding protein [Eubacteriaceae bacterium]